MTKFLGDDCGDMPSESTTDAEGWMCVHSIIIVDPIQCFSTRKQVVAVGGSSARLSSDVVVGGVCTQLAF